MTAPNATAPVAFVATLRQGEPAAPTETIGARLAAYGRAVGLQNARDAEEFGQLCLEAARQQLAAAQPASDGRTPARQDDALLHAAHSVAAASCGIDDTGACAEAAALVSRATTLDAAQAVPAERLQNMPPQPLTDAPSRRRAPCRVPVEAAQEP